MANRYVNVAITRQTAAVAKQGFGTALILGTSKAQAYKEYTSAAGISTDFGAGSDEYKIAQALFSGTPTITKVAVLGLVYNGASGNPTALTGALNTLVLTQNDWLYLFTTVKQDNNIQALDAWAPAAGKLFFADTTNTSLAVTGMNTVIMCHSDAATAFPAAAWVGVCAPKDIGSYTWTFKTLSGINPASYDDTTVTAIHAKNFNTYIKQSGVNITSNGKTAGGEYIDVIQSQLYLTARISEAVFALMATQDKIPFTDGGIALVTSTIESVLQDAANDGMIAEENGKFLYSVTAPSRSQVSATNRANRILPDIAFTATIAGAVENTTINGLLTV